MKVLRLQLGIALAAAVLLLAACGRGDRAEPSPEAVEELLATDQAFADASRELGTAEAFLRYLADDALQVPPVAEPIRGREAIYAYLLAGPDVQLVWTPEEADIGLSGTFGYTRGTYQVRRTAPGDTTPVSQGEYVNVWQRQRDGSWKVILDMGHTVSVPHG